MGRHPENGTPKFFESKIKEGGERGNEVREIVEAKMKADFRKTYSDTIVAIILEYGELKIAKPKTKRS